MIDLRFDPKKGFFDLHIVKSIILASSIIIASSSFTIILASDLQLCWTYSCFNFFVKAFDFPIKLIAFSAAMLGLMSIHHRSVQTAFSESRRDHYYDEEVTFNDINAYSMLACGLHRLEKLLKTISKSTKLKAPIKPLSSISEMTLMIWGDFFSEEKYARAFLRHAHDFEKIDPQMIVIPTALINNFESNKRPDQDLQDHLETLINDIKNLEKKVRASALEVKNDYESRKADRFKAFE